jgi:hypothetical protein
VEKVKTEYKSRIGDLLEIEVYNENGMNYYSFIDWETKSFIDFTSNEAVELVNFITKNELKEFLNDE